MPARAAKTPSSRYSMRRPAGGARGRGIAGGLSGAPCLALFLTIRLVADVSAQARPIAPGERVRITFPCDAARAAPARNSSLCDSEGTVVKLLPDMLELAVTGHYESHSLSELTRLEVRRPGGSKWLLGAGVGFVVGAGGTFAWLNSGGSTSPCDRSENQDAMSPSECLGLALVGGIAGAGLGAAVGALIRTAGWKDVPLGSLRLHLLP